MPTLQLSALQTAWTPHEQSHVSEFPMLPASPTLTNPDMVLPSTGVPPMSSPPRFIRRPPSPSYLRERSDEVAAPRNVPMTVNPHLGPISHSVMLPVKRASRSRNSYGERTSRSSASYSSSERNSIISSASTIQDGGKLAPAWLSPPPMSQRSASGSSSSGLSGMTNFLAQYPVPEPTSDEDMYDSGDGPDLDQCDTATEMEAEADAQRKKQEVREYNSAILSKRAEQILANAKQRLNVMEGNLRGARDLVAPLTAANLKRAASLGSAQFSPALSDGYGFEFMRKPTLRTLHPQASSPTMGRDYQNHARGFSETELPERPYTSLEHSAAVVFQKPTRFPVKVNESSWTHNLRGSRSHDVLAGNVVENGVPRERHTRSRQSRASPDSGLEPLHEDEEPRKTSPQPEGSIGSGSHYFHASSRPASQTSNLREQMSNLKERISSLKERAREESLKRQSLQSLRTSSPFNNAATNVPEGFYTSSSNYGTPVFDTNAGVGHRSDPNSPMTPRSVRRSHGAARTSMSGRQINGEQELLNEQSSRLQQSSTEIATRTPNSKFQIWPTPPSVSGARSVHSRTSSRASANQLYAHARQQSSQSIPMTTPEEDDSMDDSTADVDDNQPDSSPSSSDIISVSEITCSESGVEEDNDNVSIYEDAVPGPNQGVAHEDRADAFDYGQFFLHSAMAIYNPPKRELDSDGASISSTETARGPGMHQERHFTAFDIGLSAFPPPTPETPERLRIIEANLHMRPHSSDSVASFNTFATADEDHDELDRHVSRHQPPAMDWSRIPRPSSSGTTSSRPNSRPSTAVKRPHHQRDNSSDRADSGVGLPQHSRTGSTGSARRHPPTPSSPLRRGPTPTTAVTTSPRALAPKLSTTPILLASPPVSPDPAAAVHSSSSAFTPVTPQDPSTLAVHALLDPLAKPLGLRDNAALYGVIEGLRDVVRRLQWASEEREGEVVDDDDESSSLVALRRRLEEARLVLGGA